MNIKQAITAALLTLCTSSPSVAEIIPKPDGTGGDARITHFHYKENQVYRIFVAERLITYVHFPPGEVVRSLGSGDTESYQITRLQGGRVIAFKPEILNSDTNLTVLTNRGIYNFSLTPTESRARVPFRVTFYTNPNHSKSSPSSRVGSVSASALKSTGRVVNKNYSKSGSAKFSPRAVWDDGVHTYMQIPENAELPGIFRVLPDGREQLVNTTTKARGVIQIHGLSELWSVRIEDEAICIRNDTVPTSQQRAES